mgnify:CR=1 FL=1
MRWDDAIEGYWLAKARQVSNATVSDYNGTFRRFGAWIKGKQVESVKVKDVDAFLTHLDEDLDLAPKTVLNAWVALSSFWTWAAKEFGYRHIMREVDKPKARPKPMLPYSEEEVRRLLDAVARMRAYSPASEQHVDGRRPTAYRDIAIMLVLLDCGLRASELCALAYRDYDRKQGRLSVRHGKGDKPRVVFIGQSAQRALWRYLVSRDELRPADPLFARSDNGGPMERNGLRMMIERAGARAGVPGACAHRFRHTFAVNYLRNGGNIAALQDMLGHSTLEMVRRYARLAEVDLAQAQKRASPADNWRL